MPMETIVEAKRLRKYYVIPGLFARKVKYIKAVDDVDIYVRKGETLGLVGESGCGKTTLGKVIIRLLDPTAGKIFFERKEITNITGRELRVLRREMQIVFQDPYSSLNPRKCVRETISEPLIVHHIAEGWDVSYKVVEMLNLVGLREEYLDRYPHELSGGERQRVAIARALILKPKFVVLDEPTSALDVSVQAKVLNLLKELQLRLGLTYLFISHDLGIIRYMSDRIMVMYLGKVVESASKKELFERPMHPYTKLLLSAVPIADPKFRDRARILPSGPSHSLREPSVGCRFYPRCPEPLGSICKKEPELIEVTKGHVVACHR